MVTSSIGVAWRPAQDESPMKPPTIARQIPSQATWRTVFQGMNSAEATMTIAT